MRLICCNRLTGLIGAFVPIILAIVLMSLPIQSAPAEDKSGSLPNTADCPLGKPTRFGEVAKVLDGQTLELADGQVLRLIGALAPHPRKFRPALRRRSKSRSLSQRSKSALRALALGKRLGLVQTGRKKNRYGQILAHAVLLDGMRPKWLQYELVARGLARAYSFPDNRACMRQLLQAEEKARKAQQGIWHTKHAFAVRQASRPQTLYRYINRFEIIEGEIVKVGQTRKSVYLNFGRNWRKDFTVMIGARDKKRFTRAGIDFDKLAGQRVRVRGWLESWNGPMLKLTHPEQLERLQDAGKAGASADTLLPDLPRNDDRAPVTPPDRGRTVPTLIEL